MESKKYSESKKLKLKYWFKAHSGTIMSIEPDNYGSYLLTSGKDRKVLLWNIDKQLCMETYSGHGYEVRSVALNSDRTKFASVGIDKQVFLWDTFNGKIIRKFFGHELPINSVRWGAQDQVLITCSDDKTLKFWDCRSKNKLPLQTINSFNDSVTSLIVHDLYREIFAGSLDGTIRRFDIRAGKILIDEIQHAVTSMAISNDGECILAACLDSTIRLIERSRGKLLNSYTGHKNVGVRIDCCFTNSYNMIAGGSEDGIVYIWNRENAKIDQKIDVGDGLVISIAPLPSNRRLITGGVDGIIKIWD